jgi:hypothetical protein
MAEEIYSDKRKEMRTDPYKLRSPLKYFKDKERSGWLRKEGPHINKDSRERGCGRCDEMAFPTGGG